MCDKNFEPRAEGGYVIVTVAITIVVLLGFAAMAVDSGVLYSSRTSAQRIADGAALAGAASFIFDPNGPQPATAEAHARAFAEGKSILGDTVTAGEVTVTVDIVNQRVTVHILRNEETYLAKAIGMTDVDVGVTGTAEAGSQFVGSECVKPWFLPNSVFLDNPEITPLADPASDACSACGDAGTNPNYDPEAFGQLLIHRVGTDLVVTPFAESLLLNQRLITLKPNNPSQSLEPGQFYAIAVGGTGGNVYRDNIMGCAGPTAAVRCADCQQSEPGNMIGPTVQGTSAMIHKPTQDVISSLGPPLQIINSGASLPVQQSPSRVTVPIWDVCSQVNGTSCSDTGFCPGLKLTNGGRNVTLEVIGFADIFVEDVSNGDGVSAYVLGVHACPTDGAGNVLTTPVDSSNVMGFPLRLVRPTP